MDQLDRNLRRELDEQEATRRWKSGSGSGPGEPPGGRSMGVIASLIAAGLAVTILALTAVDLASDDSGADETTSPSPEPSMRSGLAAPMRLSG